MNTGKPLNSTGYRGPIGISGWSDTTATVTDASQAASFYNDMPIFFGSSSTDRGSTAFARRRVRRREIIAVLLWVGAAAVVYGTTPLSLPIQLFLTLVALTATGVGFLLLTRANMRDTEEAFEGSYYRLLRSQEDLITRMSMFAERRDALSSEHLHRVREMATVIAFEMGAPIEEARAIGRAAVAHDIGKIAIPEKLLGQSGKLTPEDFEAIKKHTTIGERVFGQSPLFQLERQSARHHHERWDGTGYPDSLTGTNIPMVARIAAVVEVFDVLLTNRPYREGWSEVDAIAYLGQNAGTQFDPDVVRVFARLIKEGQIRGHRAAGVVHGDATGAPKSAEPVAAAARKPRLRVVATSDDDFEDDD